MKNLKRSAIGLSIFIALLCLQGCGRDGTKEQAELRHKLFVECMELSKHVTEGDVVSRCDDVAYYHSQKILQ